MNGNLPSRKFYSYSTRDFVYHTLKEYIVSLKFEPGRGVSEKEISELFEVSRTPVREAFLKLAQEDLLEIYPQKGTFVSLIDLRHVENARFIRENLEKATVQVACEKVTEEHMKQIDKNFEQQKKCVELNDHTALYELDEQFHEMITKIANKELVWSVLQTMNAHLNRIRILSLAANINWDLILFQHGQIIESLRSRNAEQAGKAMEDHLKKLTFELEEIRANYSQFFK